MGPDRKAASSYLTGTERNLLGASGIGTVERAELTLGAPCAVDHHELPFVVLVWLGTAETTALEPGVLDNKLYVRGVGEVVETAIKGPLEKLVLVDILE